LDQVRNDALDEDSQADTPQADTPQADTAEVLSSLGIGAVVVHPVLFITEDRRLLLDWLTAQLGPPTATDNANGEYVVMFNVPEAAAQPNPEAAQEARRQAYSELAASYQ
jgi:hypothetical protein